MQGGRRGEVTEIVQNFYRFNIHKIRVSLCVCVCVCVCVRLRARVYGQKNSASGETVLRALCIDIIRGALLGNALLHLSHSLWNSVVLNEINQS